MRFEIEDFAPLTLHKQPKVSVALTAYNAVRYIRRAVVSILDQTFADFELIIVDDGSTDGTDKVLRHLAAHDTRIKLISRPNTGFMGALKEAIDHCHGEYLARMDADDIAEPHRFEKQVKLLDAQRDVAVVGTSYQLIDGRSRRLRVQHQPTDNATLQKQCLAGTTPICHPTAMIRRSAFDQIGGYATAAFPAEDLDLWLRLGEVGRLACLPDVLMQYRLHSGSISETKQSKQIDAARRVCDAAAARRGLPSTFIAQDWREGAGRVGRLKQTLKYGWWAFNSGERFTAISYGIQAIRQQLTSIAAWKLLGASALKSLPVSGSGSLAPYTGRGLARGSAIGAIATSAGSRLRLSLPSPALTLTLSRPYRERGPDDTASNTGDRSYSRRAA